MSLGTYLTGVVFLAVTWGAAAVTCDVIVRRRLTDLSGAPLALARGLVWLAALLGAHLVPGAIGVLSREAVAVVAVALAGAAWLAVPRRAGARPRAAASPVAVEASHLPALAACAAAASLILAAFARLATDAPTHIDALSFGLPGIAEWIRTGSLFEVGAYFPLFQVRTYPNTGDLFYLTSILPFGNDAFLRFATLPLLAGTGLAVYALGRELRAPASAAAVAAALVVALPTVSRPAIASVKPDVFMYATFAAGLVFLARHARTRATSDLVLAGLGIGLAFGSRWYGISAAVVTVALWALCGLVARRGLRAVAAGTVILTGTIFAAGGFWLLRNLVLTGNPIYPARIAPFGLTVFDAPRDVITEKLGFSIADRLRQPGFVADSLAPGLREQLSLPGLLLAAGVVATLVLCVRRSGRAPDPRPLALCALALVLAAVYAITPASAQGLRDFPLPGIVGETLRWVAPTFLAAGGVASWAASSAGRFRPALEGAGALAVVVGLSSAFELRAADVLLCALAVLALGAVATLARTRPSIGLAAACSLAVAALALAHADQRRYNAHRYLGASPISDWIIANAPSGKEVGFAGGWRAGYVPIYPAFGPSYGNGVRYVGAVRRGQVLQFRRAASFTSELRRGGYDVLVVGRIAPPNLDRARELRALDDPPEARWARGEGYAEVLRDGDFILMRRRPPPAGS